MEHTSSPEFGAKFETSTCEHKMYEGKAMFLVVEHTSFWEYGAKFGPSTYQHEV